MPCGWKRQHYIHEPGKRGLSSSSCYPFVVVEACAVAPELLPGSHQRPPARKGEPGSPEMRGALHLRDAPGRWPEALLHASIPRVPDPRRARMRSRALFLRAFQAAPLRRPARVLPGSSGAAAAGRRARVGARSAVGSAVCGFPGRDQAQALGERHLHWPARRCNVRA